MPRDADDMLVLGGPHDGLRVPASMGDQPRLHLPILPDAMFADCDLEPEVPGSGYATYLRVEIADEAGRVRLWLHEDAAGELLPRLMAGYQQADVAAEQRDSARAQLIEAAETERVLRDRIAKLEEALAESDRWGMHQNEQKLRYAQRGSEWARRLEAINGAMARKLERIVLRCGIVPTDDALREIKEIALSTGIEVGDAG